MRSLPLTALLILTVTGLAAAQTGTFTTFGTACPGTDGTPKITSPDLPTIGKSLTLELKMGKKDGNAFLIFGATKTSYKGLKLPFDMEPIGAKGCTILVGYSILTPTKLDSTGNAKNTFAVPNQAALVGLVYYNQYFILDAKANRLGAIMSNASESKIGK